MKSKNKKYKFSSGVQIIAPDTPDYGGAYGIRQTQNAKQEMGSNIAATAADMYMPGLGSGLKGAGALTDSLTKDAKGNYKNEFAESANFVLNPLATAGKFGSALTGDKTAAADLFSGMPATKLISKAFGIKNPFGKTTEEKVKEEAKKAEHATAMANANKGFNTAATTDAQAKVAKKGKYKVKAKQPRMIVTEGREPIFSPKKPDGTRDLLYYNPNDPTHEEGGVKAVVMPKNRYNNGVGNLMPRRPASKYSLVGSGNMAVGAKQIKVDNINNTAFNQHLAGEIPVNAANNFMQPRAGMAQVARNIPEDRRKEKIRTERSHKKSNPDTNRIIDPPMLYEMKPPAPRSTFNTKNNFKNGGKTIKVYADGTDGTQAGATYKHTKKFGNRQDFQNALAAHDDSLALHGQSRFFEDAVNIGRKYHPTVETLPAKKYSRSFVSKGPDPNTDPTPFDYKVGNENNWGNPQLPGFERITSKNIQPIKTNSYTRKESTYKSEKEYNQKKDPNAHAFYYDVDMYKHPEMRPIFEPDTVNPVQGKKAKLSTSSDTVTTRKPVKPVIVPTTPIITPIKVPTRETPRDTTSTKTTPVVTTNPTVTPARSKFLGKEKTGLQKFAEGFINKVGSSSRMSNGKRVRVAK